MNTLENSIKKIKLANTLKEKKQLAEDLLKAMVNNKNSWINEKYYHPNKKQGFSGWVIHQEPDHSLCLVIQSWCPHKGAPPHNHDTWSITVGVIGEEEHTVYENLPRPYPKKHQLSIKKIIACKPGTSIHLEKNAIHSVKNKMSDITLSITFYGKHPNYTNRVQIDPDTHRVEKFICEEEN